MDASKSWLGILMAARDPNVRCSSVSTASWRHLGKGLLLDRYTLFHAKKCLRSKDNLKEVMLALASLGVLVQLGNCFLKASGQNMIFSEKGSFCLKKYCPISKNKAVYTIQLLQKGLNLHEFNWILGLKRMHYGPTDPRMGQRTDQRKDGQMDKAS